MVDLAAATATHNADLTALPPPPPYSTAPLHPESSSEGLFHAPVTETTTIVTTAAAAHEGRSGDGTQSPIAHRHTNNNSNNHSTSVAGGFCKMLCIIVALPFMLAAGVIAVAMSLVGTVISLALCAIFIVLALFFSLCCFPCLACAFGINTGGTKITLPSSSGKPHAADQGTLDLSEDFPHGKIRVISSHGFGSILVEVTDDPAPVLTWSVQHQARFTSKSKPSRSERMKRNQESSAELGQITDAEPAAAAAMATPPLIADGRQTSAISLDPAVSEEAVAGIARAVIERNGDTWTLYPTGRPLSSVGTRGSSMLHMVQQNSKCVVRIPRSVLTVLPGPPALAANAPSSAAAAAAAAESPVLVGRYSLEVRGKLNAIGVREFNAESSAGTSATGGTGGDAPIAVIKFGTGGGKSSSSEKHKSAIELADATPTSSAPTLPSSTPPAGVLVRSKPVFGSLELSAWMGVVGVLIPCTVLTTVRGDVAYGQVTFCDVTMGQPGGAVMAETTAGFIVLDRLTLPEAGGLTSVRAVNTVGGIEITAQLSPSTSAVAASTTVLTTGMTPAPRPRLPAFDIRAVSSAGPITVTRPAGHGFAWHARTSGLGSVKVLGDSVNVRSGRSGEEAAVENVIEAESRYFTVELK
ncbi:hypothetical protein BC828DRAFT_409569 [Blastocladiella britannica]|nr:hypothetical protein BC828DRAFT_409569 [Blastocladiella britannica]